MLLVPTPSAAPADVLAAALPDLDVEAVAAPQPGPWLGGTDAPPFRLTHAGGEPCLWHEDRLPEIARDLDRAAALLDAVEAASGWRFEPALTLPGPDGGGALVAVRNGASCLQLALPASVDLLPERLRAAAEAAPLRGDRPTPVRLLLSGPALGVEEAAALGPGDLLLLPPVATVRLDAVGPDAPAGTWSLELATGLLTPGGWSDDGARGFAVPVSVALPPVALTPDALAGAEPLRLPPLREGALVQLAAAGRPLGAGTLVRLGDRVAVELAAPAQEFAPR